MADFRSSFGVWLMDGETGTWVQLNPAGAKSIVTGDLDGNGIDEVIVDFGSVHGMLGVPQ